MLVEFSVGNYRSFNSIQTLSFKATGLRSENGEVDNNNTIDIDKERLLKLIGVYGPNGSGKSNLVKALSFFRRMIATSLESEKTLTEGINPFKQSSVSADNAGFFQAIVILNGSKYRYGFTLGQNQITGEWLRGPADKNETWYFNRFGKNITINYESFPEGSGIPHQTKLRENALFLNFCASYDGIISELVRKFFVQRVQLDLGRATFGNLVRTNLMIRDGNKDTILNWMKEAGLSFNDLSVDQLDKILETKVFVTKNIYNEKGEVTGTVDMDLISDESSGTQKFYSLIGKLNYLFNAGGLFIVDEIDSNFHPTLLQKIISLFTNASINKSHSQLLFTSHDTNLMSPELMRRDQFYFTEKSVRDESILYSLADLKGIRNNADFAKQYLSGFYGALPVLGNYLEESGNSEQ